MKLKVIVKYLPIIALFCGLLIGYFIGVNFSYKKTPEINNFIGITPGFHYTESINSTEEIIFLNSENRLSYLWRVYPLNDTNSYLHALDIFLSTHDSKKIYIEYSWILGKKDSVELMSHWLCNWSGIIEQDTKIPQLHQLSPYSTHFLADAQYNTNNTLYFTLNVTLYLVYE